MFDNIDKYQSGLTFKSKEIEGYFIDYICGPINRLVITFENADQPKQPRNDSMRLPWGAAYLNKKGFCIIGVKPKKVDWYRGSELHRFFRSYSFKTFASSFSDVTFYGSSMGGFAALAFAESLPGSKVIAFNPQSTLNPDLVPWEKRYEEGRIQDWRGDFSDGAIGAATAEKVYVVYDPRFKPDAAHVKRLPTSNLVPFKMPFVGHVVASWMQEAGIFNEFLELALFKNPTEEIFRDLALSRRKTARYFLVMGQKTRSSSVALWCANRLLQSKLPRHHQLEFANLVEVQKLYREKISDETKKSLLDFDADVLVKILKIASDAGFSEKSLEIIKNMVPPVEPDWTLLVLSAECCHRTGRLPEARDFAQKAVEIAPAVGNCYRVLARVLFDMGELNSAVDVSSHAVKVDPGSWLGWWDLSKFHAAVGDIASAFKAAQNAASINPSEGDIIKQLRHYSFILEGSDKKQMLKSS